MAHKALICGLMAGTLALSLISPASAATSDETALAANYLREQGIMVGDSNGKMNLESGLTRAQLAVVLGPSKRSVGAGSSGEAVLYQPMSIP